MIFSKPSAHIQFGKASSSQPCFFWYGLLLAHIAFCILCYKLVFPYLRVRKNLRTHAGDIDAAAVPCGFGRAIGNKVYLCFC